jgi:hypothetical protein
MLSIHETIAPALAASHFNRSNDGFIHDDGRAIELHLVGDDKEGSEWWLVLADNDKLLMEGRAVDTATTLKLLWAYGFISWAHVQDVT